MFMIWLDIDIEQKQRNTKTKKRRNILGLVATTMICRPLTSSYSEQD